MRVFPFLMVKIARPFYAFLDLKAIISTEMQHKIQQRSPHNIFVRTVSSVSARSLPIRYNKLRKLKRGKKETRSAGL